MTIDDYLQQAQTDALAWYHALNPPAAPPPATVTLGSGGLSVSTGTADVAMWAAIAAAIVAVILLLK